MYIIAPMGIIPLDKIPENIGLIEIDFENFNMWQGGRSPISFDGLYVTKKTRKNKRNIENRDKRVGQMIEEIARRSTTEMMFNGRVDV